MKRDATTKQSGPDEQAHAQTETSAPGKQVHREHGEREHTGWEDISAATDAPAGATHAYRTSRVGPPNHAVHTVQGIGNVDSPLTELDDAIAKRDRARVLLLVKNMSTEIRAAARSALESLAAFMSAREILTVGGLVEAGAAPTVMTALEASPKLTAEQLRAFVADLSPFQVTETLDADGFVPALRRVFPRVSPVELFPQLGEEGGLSSEAVLDWLIDAGPPKRVARLLVAVPPQLVDWHAQQLDRLGERGWNWLDAIDSQLAGIAVAGTLEEYRERATARGRDVTQLQRWERVSDQESERSPAERKADARSLRARRAEVIAKPVAEIQQLTQHAGLAGAEQLDFILDKPGLTPAHLREVTQVMETAKIVFHARLTSKLRTRFPQASPEDLFSGDLPTSLVLAGARDRALAKWLVGRAQPEAILRIIAAETSLIAPWCETLKAIGVGFDWVHDLGGQTNDYLLRRFVLQCPDAPTRDYVQQRLLGEGDVPAQPSVTAPTAQPTAFTSSRSHLDADLDRYKDKRSIHASDAITADVGDLTPAELDALRHDVARLKQVLAAANQRTLAQILDYVQPSLQVGVLHAKHTHNNRPHLISWMQTRPASEVLIALSSTTTVAHIQRVAGEMYGPLELLPASAQPAVLGTALQQNPSIAKWLLLSDPTRVLHAISSPAVIDPAVRALAQLETIAIEHWLPSAEALGAPGKSILEKLGTRAQGELRDLITERLKPRLAARDTRPSADADEEDYRRSPDTEQTALTLRGTGPFADRARQLLANHAPAASVVALCRAEPTAWQQVAAEPDLATALHRHLELAPNAVFPEASLSSLLARASLHTWIMSTTPAFKILNAIDPSSAPVIVATLDSNTQAASDFLFGLPRGRALTSDNKATLRRMGKLAGHLTTLERLFHIAFDIGLIPATANNANGQIDPADKFSRPELEKLWSVLELLPPAHVDQKSISHFQALRQNADNGTAGVYDPQTQGVALQKGQLSATSTKQYDHHLNLSEAEAIEALGSRSDFQRFLADGLMQENDDGTFTFKRTDSIESYPHTILHEVGHAVDAMLGSATELIYQLAGWKRFSVNDVDSWARQLGGWDVVTDADKIEIRKLWKLWLNGGGKGTVAQLAGDSHVALAPQYANAGIAQAARLDLGSLQGIGTQYSMASHTTQSFFTLTARGYNAAPSTYSLTAPAEYFAECYAIYYRDYDGSPTSAARKGRTLAPWIQAWMTKNIDAIGHNPTRHGRA